MNTNTLRLAVVAMATGVVGLAPVTAQETITVELLGNNTFAPSDITIHAGDTVHWVWVAGFHNVVSGEVVIGGEPGDFFKLFMHMCAVVGYDAGGELCSAPFFLFAYFGD